MSNILDPGFRPSISPNPASSRQSQRDSVYSVFTFDSRPVQGVTSGKYEKVFDVVGDHLHVAKIRGSRQLYVRLNARSNPAIALHEGMTLRRSFSRIWVSLSSGFDLIGELRTRATFYASFGPLVVEVGQRKYGLRLSNRSDVRVIDTAGFRVGAFLSQASIPGSAGQFGGTVMIRNEDLGNTVYLSSGTTTNPLFTAGATGFPIYPGECFTLQLDDDQANGGQTGDQDLNYPALWLITAAGTARVSVFFSDNVFDRYEVGQTNQEAYD
jgi:hypothetical protein